MILVPPSRLERLLRPTSLAFIGGTPAEIALDQSQKLGFAGDLWLVHPTRSSNGDRTVYPSVADLPSAPDAALIAVNREATLGVVRDLAAIGAGVAVCHASGYAEVGKHGVDLSDELLAAAGTMAVIGPNCYGTLNALSGAALWPDQHGLERVDRGAAFVTQSGNIAVNLTMQQRGIDVAHVLTLGNQIDVGIEECLEALVSDPSVTAVGLHVEALNDVERFAAACHSAADRGVPVIALKTGSSVKGASIAVSHTSSMVGDDNAYTALFERLGVRRVRSVSELLDTTKILSRIGPLPGKRLVSMSCSGGEASLVADRAEHFDVTFNDFSDGHADRIAATLSDLVTVSNPLDYHTFIWGDRERLERCFSAVLSEGLDAAVLVLDMPKPGLDDSSWWPTLEAFAGAARKWSLPAIVVASMAENMPPEARAAVDALGLVAMSDIDMAIRGLEAAAWLGRTSPGDVQLPTTEPPDRTIVLDEAEAKHMLSMHGVAVPAGERVDCEGALSVARRIGYPVVAKVTDVAHKSEVGGVIVGIANDEEMATAITALGDLSETLLIETCVSSVAVELLVAVARVDPCGYLLTIGSGGTLVELIGDSASSVLPVSREQIAQLLASLACWPLLTGHRGRKPADVDAVIDAVEAMCTFVCERDDVVELEVNPLMVEAFDASGSGATVVDALVTVGRSK
jgi:acyl-CoA synthetase (NDP forming)